MRKGLLFLLVSLLSFTPFSIANTQDLGEIKTMAASFLQDQLKTSNPNWEIKAGYLDDRLQLSACPKELLSFSLPGGTDAEHTTLIQVRCNNAKPWSLYLPIMSHLYEDVIVARRPLHKGERITTTDLTTARRDVKAITQGYYRNAEDLVDYELKRPVLAGNVISNSDINKPALIKRGDNVTIETITGNIKVSMKGIAQSDGTIHDTITVKNTQSQREVEGKVINSTTVRVIK